MRLQAAIWLATFAALCVAEEQQGLWSWNAEDVKEKQIYAVESNKPSGSGVEDATNYNETAVVSVDDVIDTILSSTRQGRNLDGFDEVYSDPTVQDAIQKGDDSQARNLIKDKLCTLGLMQCDNEENVEGKRPFLPPGDFIYAQQPPNGNGPYRGPPRPPSKVMYGPPRPMPNNFGPPRKVGYVGSSSRPIYSSLPGPGSIISAGPPPDFQGPIYHSKPPGPVFEGGNPYKYESFGGHSLSHHGHEEHHELGGLSDGGLTHLGQPKPTIVVNAHGGAASSGQASAPSSVNVHHHYHHLDKDAAQVPSVVVPVPVPVGNGLGSAEFSSHGHHESTGAGFTGVNSGFTGGSSGFDYQNFKQSSLGSNGFSGGLGGGVNSGGFNGGGLSSANGFSASSGYGAGVKPVFESVNNYDSHAAANTGPPVFGSQGSSGLGGSINSYGQSVSGIYNGNSGSFHSGNPDYYKKALGGSAGYNSINSQKPQYSNGYAGQYGGNYNGNGDNYQSLESARQDNVDCVCVPFDQCPARDVFGRKGDLILPIDPRNLGSDIEALSDDENSNGTASAVRVTKEAPQENIEDKSEVKKDAEPNNSETKKISKRDVSEKKSDDIAKADGEARLFGLGALGGGAGGVGGGLGKKKVEPQFGVSFGLPYPSGGYPLNTLNGGVPGQNPYFGSISPNGLNLGLVNVNPLVSFQFAKNEYGEKLFKPLVNLHVTPNEHLIHKVGNLFKAKKYGAQQSLYNQHYHTHTHFPVPPPVYHPHHYENSGHYYGGGSEYYGSGISGGHYGLSGPGGYYREGSSFPPTGPTGPIGPIGSIGQPTGPYYQGGPTGPSEFDYNPNGFYSRSLNGTSADGSGSFVPSNNYQNVYTNDNQLPLNDLSNGYASNYDNYNQNQVQSNSNQNENRDGQSVSFPNNRRKRSTENINEPLKDLKAEETSANSINIEKRQAFNQIPQQCGPRQVCCRRPVRPAPIQGGQCGRRNTNGITGRIKTPVYVDGDSEFGEYPWQIAILKKDPKESVYVCGGTLIDHQHIITAAHCVKQYTHFDLRVRLGEWDVNHDVEFFPYIERDVVAVTVHPEYYAGTLDNDLAVLTLNSPVDFANNPHISPACLPDKYSDFSGQRCFTTGWGKDAFGDYGKYQNILKEVDVPIIGHQQCQQQLRNTRLGYTYQLNPGFVCAGGEEGKDACKGDGGGPLVCERNGAWQLVGVVSWGIGCGQVNVPGVYVKVAHYLDWIQQITQQRF